MKENICYFESVKKSCELFLKSLEPVPQLINAYGDLIGQKEKALYW